MPLYYNGNLNEDLLAIRSEKHLVPLSTLGSSYGYGRIRAVVQHLEADKTKSHITTVQQKLSEDTVAYIEAICTDTGYRRVIEIIQILWAEYLRGKGIPTSGALGYAD